MQTYGIYAVSPKGANIKDDKDNGWVGDFKWGFSRGVKPERRLGLEHIPVLKGAARDGGKIRLEVTPMLDGQPLEPVLLPVTLRGNITIDEDGDVNCTTRVTFDAMETAGLGVDAILGATCCLECTVSNQPTLDEQVKDELAQPDAPLAGQETLPFDQVAAEVAAHLGPNVTVRPASTFELDTPAAMLARLDFGQLSVLLQHIGRNPADWCDPQRTDEQDAGEWRELLAQHWGEIQMLVLDMLGAQPTRPASSNIPLDPREPGEDLPFPLDGDGSTQPSA